ncbi:MAG: hypothetical protein ABSA11_08285 [Candidatus Bathyarchaeia archaeon]
MDAIDIKSWEKTAIILGLISIFMFGVQRSKYMFLDPVFELFIFHVPAILAVSIYLYYRRKEPTPAPVDVKS